MKRLLLLFLLVSLSAAISSSEALDKVSDCVKKQNTDMKQFAKPMTIGADSYWLFSYSIDSPQKIVIMVSDSEGQLLTDETLLLEAGNALYDYGVMEDYVKKRGWTVEYMLPMAESATSAVQRYQSTLETFSSQTEEKYPKLSFQKISDGLLELGSQTEELKTTLLEVSNNQQYFDADYNSVYLRQLVDSYNLSFDRLSAFLSSYEAYVAAISDLELEVYKQGIPDPDGKNINANLESLRDIGVSSMYSKFKASDPRLLLTRLYASRDSWVNDSVSSFVFQEARCEAVDLYNQYKPVYDSTVANEAALRSVGLGDSVDNLTKSWAKIERYNRQKSVDGYKKMADEIPQLAAMMDSIKEMYALATQPTPTPRPQAAQGLDLGGVLLILLFLGVAAYGYYRFKKSQEEEAP